MDLQKADFFTVAGFGTKTLFCEKLKLEKKEITDVLGMRNKNGASLLEESLSLRKFDIAQLLLDGGIAVNVVTKENCNELHFIAAHLHEDGAVGIAKQLIEKGVDLNLPDKKYGNTPFWYLCMSALRKSDERIMNLIECCMERKPDIDWKNNTGRSTRDMILQRGNKTLIEKVVGKND